MYNDKIDLILAKLNKSKFRRSFHLKGKELIYFQNHNLTEIRTHAINFIEKRIAPQNILNDGKQTPFHGHPVFIAQHATATCCRNCLYKWYKIPKDRSLTEKEQKFIVDLIIAWLLKNN